MDESKTTETTETTETTQVAVVAAVVEEMQVDIAALPFPFNLKNPEDWILKHEPATIWRLIDGIQYEIHPTCHKHIAIRQYNGGVVQREHRNLEKRFQAAGYLPTENIFYVYMEDDDSLRHFTKTNHAIHTIRYGLVFMGDHWIERIAAFPKDHSDGDVPPYKMVFVGHS